MGVQVWTFSQGTTAAQAVPEQEVGLFSTGEQASAWTMPAWPQLLQRGCSYPAQPPFQNPMPADKAYVVLAEGGEAAAGHKLYL